MSEISPRVERDDQKQSIAMDIRTGLFVPCVHRNHSQRLSLVA